MHATHVERKSHASRMTNNVTSNTKKLFFYFLNLGAFRYGGPLALIDSMRRDLVGENKYFSEEDYQLGLALSQIAPGPIATQLATFFGWLAGGFWGALSVTFALIFPSFVIITVLAHVYVAYSDSSWLKLLTSGAAPAVVALVAKSGWNLLRKTDLKRMSNKLIFVISFFVTVVYKQEVGWVFLAAAFMPSLLKGKYKNWAILPAFSGIADWSKLGEIFSYFFEVGAFVFGSGLVIVPFLYGGVVVEHRWLTESQFIDAMAIGLLTPGPIVITVAFIGYLVSGLSGAATSALGIFLPCFIFVVLPAPFFRRIYKQHPEIAGSAESISVAAIGAIFGGAILLIQENLHSLPQQLAAIGFLLLSQRFRKVPDPLWIMIGIAGGVIAGHL